MTLHPTIQAIRDAGPGWANWLIKPDTGSMWYQSERGTGPLWSTNGDGAYVEASWSEDRRGGWAIDLRTGDIHLQDDDGNITIVPQDEWVAVGEDE
jgi:hypothetical protein